MTKGAQRPHKLVNYLFGLISLFFLSLFLFPNGKFINSSSILFHFGKIWVWSLLHDIKYTLYSLRSLFDSGALISVILNCEQRLQSKSLVQQSVLKSF